VSKLRVAFLGSGRGSNFLAIQNNINNGMINADTQVVISNKDSKMLEVAREMDLTGIYLDPKGYDSKEEYDKELVQLLVAHGVDLVVLAGYMKILTPFFINAFEGKIINIHPSLLPAFRGLHPQQQAIDAGVKFAGATVHYVINELDAGPIIAQAVVPLYPEDDEDKLSTRIIEKEHVIYSEAIKLIIAGKA